ncbi:hypothetical protein FRX31_002221 [Thalictrum thalictroides]|uniref:Uncharacterized protein n=1 Tax=Thalictrum thalictroides TaxID=46969 RepID=A0A7J6XF97_THATH|nr:hypothetical protein FRX31_002221 [Thalictrum thalictroides]
MKLTTLVESVCALSLIIPFSLANLTPWLSPSNSIMAMLVYLDFPVLACSTPPSWSRITADQPPNPPTSVPSVLRTWSPCSGFSQVHCFWVLSFTPILRFQVWIMWSLSGPRSILTCIECNLILISVIMSLPICASGVCLPLNILPFLSFHTQYTYALKASLSASLLIPLPCTFMSSHCISSCQSPACHL